MSMERRQTLDPESEHLTCFIGGSFALAGRLFDQPVDAITDGRLARGCAYAYHSFPTGIMPERYNMIACEPQSAIEPKKPTTAASLEAPEVFSVSNICHWVRSSL